MSRNTHVRDGELHLGTEPASAVVLSDAIGAWPADTDLETFLAALDAELTRRENGSISVRLAKADAIFLVNLAASFESQGIIKANLTASSTSDAILRVAQESTLTGDAIFQAGQTDAFTADAELGAPSGTGSFTADAILLASELASLAADAVIEVTTTDDLTADAVLMPSFTADAVIADGGSSVYFDADFFDTNDFE